MIRYRETVDKDIDILAPIMRKQDVKEVFYSDGVTPKDALLMSKKNSKECFTVVEENDEDVILMFGVVEDDNGDALPWLLGSDRTAKIPKFVLENSSEKITEWKGKYNRLYNFVHAENTVSLKFLKWLGFSLDKKHEEWGHNPSQFIEFEWLNKEKEV